MLPNIDLTYLLFSVASALIALSIHEFAHGYAAYKLGDHTAANFGRLTLNPIKHIDPVGALFMVLFRFGWAKPVPISTRYFKKPRRDMALSALAGPISNLLLCIIGAFLAAFSWKLTLHLSLVPASDFWFKFANWTAIFFNLFFSINIGLAIFNLIPIPPLDGSKLLGIALPARIYVKFLRYERQISLALFVLLLLDSYVGFNLLGQLMRLCRSGIAFLISLIPYFSNVAQYIA